MAAGFGVEITGGRVRALATPARAALGDAGRFVEIRRVVSNLAVLDFETPDRRMRLRSVHPGVTPAEVLGTASFYEMFKLEPVGDYVVNVCTNISCMLLGGEELLHHLEQRLGIRAGSTTPDGKFTLEDVECIAACTEAPCLQVNYRYFHRISHDEVDVLIDDLRAGKRAHEVPRHGTLSRVRQQLPDTRAGVAPPDRNVEPPWLARNDEGKKEEASS